MENQSDKQGTVDNRYAVSPATASAISGATGAGPADQSAQPYAGFWRRTFAYLIDYVLVIFASSMLGALLATVFRGLMPIVVIVSVWLYYALMESSELQATLGKRALGIKVTDLDGNRISFGRA